MIKRTKHFLSTILVLIPINSYALVSNSIKTTTNFVSREKEINTIFTTLQKSHLVFIDGLIGIGKTELVRKFLSSPNKNYKIKWWFNCKADIENQFDDFNKEVNKDLNKPINLSSSNLVSKIDSILQFVKLSKLPTIFIFDDYLNDSDCKLIIRKGKFVENVDQIVISEAQIENENRLNLSFLSEEEALRYFLFTYKYNKGQEKELRELSKLLSFHPLSLSQAASFLNENPSITVKYYVNALKSRNVELLAARKDNSLINEEYQLSLVSALKSSFTQIKKDNINSYRLLKYSAFLDNNYVSNKLLKMLYQAETNDFSALGYLKAINPLIKYSILYVLETEDQTMEEKDFATHEFIQNIMLDETKDPKIKKEDLSKAIRAVLSLLSLDGNDPTDYNEKHMKLLPTIEKLIVLSEEYKLYTQDKFILSVVLLHYYIYNAQYKKMETVISQIDKELELSKYEFGDDESRIKLVSYNILKSVYLDSGNSDFLSALLTLKQAKEIASRVSDKTEFLVTKFFLFLQSAQVSLYSGDLEEAKSNLRIIEDKYNPIGVKELYSGASNYYFIKAKYYLELGKYPQAIEFINKCKRQSEQFEGYNIYTFPIYLLEAEVNFRQGKAQEAYNKLSKLLKDYEQLENKENQIKARILTALANCEIYLKDLEAANAHLKEANLLLDEEFKDKEEMLLLDDDFAVILTAIGDMKIAQKSYSEALVNYQKAEQIYNNRYRNKVNIDHLSILFTKIAKAYKYLGDYYNLERYFNLHQEIFGIENQRSKDIYLDLIESKQA